MKKKDHIKQNQEKQTQISKQKSKRNRSRIKKITHDCLLTKTDITNQIIGDTIAITLSDGNILQIEMFQRHDKPCISIRGNASLSIMPQASNSIDIGVIKA